MEVRDDGLSDEARDLLRRLYTSRYLCWNSHKMEGPAHDLIMARFAEGRRPPGHRNWYIDITAAGHDYVHAGHLGAVSETAIPTVSTPATLGCDQRQGEQDGQ